MVVNVVFLLLMVLAPTLSDAGNGQKDLETLLNELQLPSCPYDTSQTEEVLRKMPELTNSLPPNELLSCFRSLRLYRLPTPSIMSNIGVAAFKSGFLPPAIEALRLSCEAELKGKGEEEEEEEEEEGNRRVSGMYCTPYAKVLAVSGQKEEGSRVLNECVTSSHWAWNCYFGMGVFAMESKKYSDAIRFLKTSLRLAKLMDEPTNQILRIEHNLKLALHLTGVADARHDTVDPRVLASDDIHLLKTALKTASMQSQVQIVSQVIDKLMKLAPNDASVVFEIAEALNVGGVFQHAAQSYLRSAKLFGDSIAKPHCRLVELSSEIGDWITMEKELEIAVAILEQHKDQIAECIQPIQALLWPVSAAFVRLSSIASARRVADDAAGDVSQISPFSSEESDSVARLPLKWGYISSNLQGGAVFFMIQGLWQQHDSKKVELFSYSTAPFVHSSDAEKKSLQNLQTFTKALDVSKMPYVDSASRIRADALDVLIDINCWTEKPAVRILHLRVAPLQISFMGFPGTAGSEFIDYSITDKTASPPDLSSLYTEKLILVQPSYYTTAYSLTLPKQSAEVSVAELRQKYGLPPNPTVVFVSFNRIVKLDRFTFSCWMSILLSVPDSVLWLLNIRHSSAPIENLKKHLEMNNIDPNRIVLANFVSWEENVDRCRAADVFLDSFPYNAHSTGANALWVGIPIVTLATEKMAGRVGASLMSATEGSKFIARTPAEYIHLTTALVKDRMRLKREKELMLQRVRSSTLFSERSNVESVERGVRMASDLRKSLGSEFRYNIIVSS